MKVCSDVVKSGRTVSSKNLIAIISRYERKINGADHINEESRKMEFSRN